jgi:hypothetical protein
VWGLPRATHSSSLNGIFTIAQNSHTHLCVHKRTLAQHQVVQGILQCDTQNIREAVHAHELFYHESLRVFHDRLINEEDKKYYYGMLAEMAQKHFKQQVHHSTHRLRA